MPTDAMYLRMHRKRSNLTQEDLAFLLGLSQKASISHWEKGNRKPTLEMFCQCHLIFDLPFETLFYDRSEELAERIMERTQELIKRLLQERPTPKTACRIEFLETVVKRLSE